MLVKIDRLLNENESKILFTYSDCATHGEQFYAKNSKSRFSQQFGNLTRVLTLTSPTIAHFNKNFKQHTHSREIENVGKFLQPEKYISFSYHNFPQLNDINTISFGERSECGNINMDCDPARM